MLQEILHFFGRAICHQIEERSLLASGETLSVCARDTGIYFGIFSSLFYLHMTKRKTNITIPTIRTSFFLLLLMAPMIMDGLGSYIHIFESSNVRRLVTGICFGLVLPYFLYPMVLGKALKQNAQPVITKAADFLIPLLISCSLGGLVYWGELPFIIIDSLLILVLLCWGGLLVSFLFSKIQHNLLKWTFSIAGSLTVLSFLSILHKIIIS
ncbi:DUF2085 domain-containing protein [Neobacillus mesonae]|uniref:DUF2085 domain-containing protein n=1 Tax=Neobacillus mesonae TaxID=1193713 RepID=A0A3T0I3H4_9BACI|nr:DUF2085 domain-containing protein [Neobacillus mesonae]AZU63880.1 hypothetical protein CHR53_22970 [Neobacillus mesonae]